MLMAYEGIDSTDIQASQAKLTRLVTNIMGDAAGRTQAAYNVRIYLCGEA